jgi:hypothetical protein
VIARGPEGAPVDLFDVSERLGQQYSRIYVVDLDGIERDRPQLDYIQEIARDADIWVDAGVRSADQAIDVLVAGAQRAVLSTRWIPSDRELRKAWKISTDLAVEIEVEDGVLAARNPEWAHQPVPQVAQSIRALAEVDLVLSYRNAPVDWATTAALAADVPIWVDGSFSEEEAHRLGPARCRGGIFHLHRFLAALPSEGVKA